MQINVTDLIRETLIDHYGHQVQQANNVMMFELGIPIAVELQDNVRMIVSVLIPFALPDDYNTLEELMVQNSIRTNNVRYGLAHIAENVKAYQLSWICEYEDMIDTIERLRAEARRTVVYLAVRQGRNGTCLN